MNKPCGTMVSGSRRTVSIITITYNAAETLERTIESVERQDYGAIEYIVVDGASTDGTMEIVGRHSEIVSKYVSEPDGGIYFAMNKGLAMSTGEYVWFLNAGDELKESGTVRLMMSKGGRDADVYYGDTVITRMDGSEIGKRRLSPPENLTRDSFRRGMLVCHQAFVARRTICQPYDTQYRVSADYEWCLSILERSRNTVNTGMTLVRFLDGGVTKHNIGLALRERFVIMSRHFGLASTIVHHIPIAAKFFWFWATKGWF